jgi:assimilatory nitrate reductase catalytic subunit
MEAPSTCCYCGVGCGVLIQAEGGRITGVRGDPEHPANFGRLCTKGATLHLSATQANRALYPELRKTKTEPRKRASWDEALTHAATKFAETIKQHGPDAVAFYISGQLLTEDYYVFNKLAKGLVGTNNVDTNSRLCMSSAVAGYKKSLGADAPPACYEDIDFATTLFIAGSNTAFAHPIVFRRIEDAKAKNPHLKIVVVDPRRTVTAEAADLHLAIQPGTDIALFNAMLHVILAEELIDEEYIDAYTEGFEALAKVVAEYSPEKAALICDIPARDIVQAAHLFARSRSTLSMYCQGLNQSSEGTHKNSALINLHLATGQIGRVGAGPFSLTGQPNAMGGREVGGMANLLSAHRDLANPGDRAEVAKLWGVDNVPAKPGKTAVELFEAIHAGEIKAVWIACTNPAQSMPDADRVRAALEKCEFVVVQEAFTNTDTVQYADLLLPATTWGEKDGTVTNSERRISRVRPAVEPPGEARHDWRIATEFARALAAAQDRKALGKRLFPYGMPQQVFDEHRETTRGRDLDISGLTYSILQERGPQQWPFPEGARQGQARLYEDGRFPTPTGRARFVAAKCEGVAEKVSDAYPLTLNTGRLRDHWHGMSRTGRVAQLFNHVGEAELGLHAADLASRGLEDGNLVRIESTRGSAVLRVRGSAELRRGCAFVPMHWGGQFMAGSGVNALTSPAIDPFSKQPELKHAAINVARFVPQWRAIYLRSCADADAAAVVAAQIAPLLAQVDFAASTLAGRDAPLVRLELAHSAKPDAGLVAALDVLFGLANETELMLYRDARRGVEKRALFEADQLVAVRFENELQSAGWVQEAMLSGSQGQELRVALFAPLSARPGGFAPRGRVVCSCLDVAEQPIRQMLERGSTLSEVQAKLKCGTSCGSCVPELKRLAAHTPVAARAA